MVAAARRRDRHDVLVDQLGAERALAVTTDVAERESVEALMGAAAQRFGGIDILVSNAGRATIRPFDETTAENWFHMMSTNVDRCFFGAKAALPYLERSRRSIVQVGALGGLGGDRRVTAFNAAKGGLVHFTRGLALDLGPFGIRVNTGDPSPTTTEERARTAPFSQLTERVGQRQALVGHATPADIPAAVTVLASEDARFITGLILPVDGGSKAASGQPNHF